MKVSNIINILHVEDDESDAHLMGLFLNSEPEDTQSYNITVAGNLNDALNILDEGNSFNVILLDLNLPDGDGLNNITSIKNINADIPIVVVTGVSDEQTASGALQLGAQECLVKAHGNPAIIKRVIQSSIHRKKAETELAKKAYYDDLTGLPNRLYFENAARAVLKNAKRWKRKDAIMFIDLNKFKAINDTLGHEAGNAVLKELAKRLTATLRTSDLIARYAGDEFVVYMDCGGAEITKELCIYVAEKIVNAVEKPINIDGEDLEISLSIGIAMYPDAGETFDILLKNADKAMYEAKNSNDTKYVIVGGQNNSETNSFALPSCHKNTFDAIATNNNTPYPTILLVESNEENQNAYRKMLNPDAGKPIYNFLTANNLKQAYEVLENSQPECIILDYYLPDGTGLEFLEKFTRTGRTINSSVIIAIGQNNYKISQKAMVSGAKDYIAKGEDDAARVCQIVSNAVDNTYLKRSIDDMQEQLKMADIQSAKFGQVVAHDLKSPMRRISMFCDLLVEENSILLNENAYGYVERIRTNSKRMTNLIHGLLNYAHVSTEKEERLSISLKTLAQEIIDDLKPWLIEQNATILIDDMLEWPVYSGKIRQLLKNFIVNAVTYKQNHINPVVHVYSKIKNGKCVISVKDNGRGIPTNQIKKLLTPFHRLHSADEIEGAGLGLSICDKIVKEHEGEINISSKEGEGSVFSAVLS